MSRLPCASIALLLPLLAAGALASPPDDAAPQLHVRPHPAGLVLVDGEPDLAEVSGTTLLEVLDASAILAFDRITETWYVRGPGYWLTAPALEGPWTRSEERLEPLDVLLPADEDLELADEPTPEVIVSAVPAELVIVNGPPRFEAIPGTKLLFVTNTDGDLFQQLSTRTWHALAGGRWYAAESLEGPWTPLAPSRLPADFSVIPPGHAKDRVRASVPGTRESRAALEAARAPTMVNVPRDSPAFHATWIGQPEFEPIPETAVAQAVNSPQEIFEVDGLYYALDAGVWYVSDSPDGPWQVADFVPPEIYGIPAESPSHHVTWVRPYDSTLGYVTFAWGSSYLGVSVRDGLLVRAWGGGHRPPWLWRQLRGRPWPLGTSPGWDPASVRRLRHLEGTAPLDPRDCGTRRSAAPTSRHEPRAPSRFVEPGFAPAPDPPVPLPVASASFNDRLGVLGSRPRAAASASAPRRTAPSRPWGSASVLVSAPAAPTRAAASRGAVRSGTLSTLGDAPSASRASTSASVSSSGRARAPVTGLRTAPSPSPRFGTPAAATLPLGDARTQVRLVRGASSPGAWSSPHAGTLAPGHAWSSSPSAARGPSRAADPASASSRSSGGGRFVQGSASASASGFASSR